MKRSIFLLRLSIQSDRILSNNHLLSEHFDFDIQHKQDLFLIVLVNMIQQMVSQDLTE